MERAQFIEKYRDHVLEHGKPPPTVFRFAKDLGVSEREFFEQFASFEAVESAIWKDLVAETVQAISHGEEWAGFSAQQKLLTFYYAYFENILDHRSFFLARFPRFKSKGLPSSRLRMMKDEFCAFAKKVIHEGIEQNEVACRGRLNDTYPTGMFGHFLSAIEFNLRDDSSGFERTDAYIEKSVKLGFDLIGSQVFDSAFDFARFLTGRSWGDKGNNQ